MKFIDLQLDNTKYPILDGKVVIKVGRAGYNDITIPSNESSEEVSREHFFLYPNTSTIRNNSRKKTFINEREVPEREEEKIIDRDIIRMGSYYQLLYRTE